MNTLQAELTKWLKVVMGKGETGQGDVYAEAKPPERQPFHVRLAEHVEAKAKEQRHDGV